MPDRPTDDFQPMTEEELRHQADLPCAYHGSDGPGYKRDCVDCDIIRAARTALMQREALESNRRPATNHPCWCRGVKMHPDEHSAPCRAARRALGLEE